MGLSRLRFNPTLVRLRPGSAASSPGRRGRFQSHAGSIEAWSSSASRPSRPMFQSHAGSIEARMAAVVMKTRIEVSIPRWFD